ncbi:MAG: methylamine utilization protein MauG [Brucellaceae bacterium]|nr:methylamine utilization protein MauG [Brucellaceae bacterium]
MAFAETRQPVDPGACPVDRDGWSGRALARSLAPHPGLPPVPHPQDNPPTRAKIELGRTLFFDRRLSINKTMSCAMCHVPEQAFANWELQTAVGVEGRSVKRNAPTLANVAFLGTLFHDGRDNALETQFVGPMVAHNEMANPSVGHVVAFLKGDAQYRASFETAFGAEASLDRIGMALGSYQRTLLAADTPFDRWRYGGNTEALSASQKRGFDIFAGKGECASCHLIEEDSALFTDEQFHDTGYGWMRERQRQTPPAATAVQVAPGVVYDVDQSKIAAVSGAREADLGRYEVTEDPADRWRFRTPPLRNVAMTPPYMHDGALHSLRAVIEFYNSGGPGHAGQDPRIRPLGLSEGELDDLEAFLDSLTSPDLACLAAEARVNRPDNH